MRLDEAASIINWAIIWQPYRVSKKTDSFHIQISHIAAVIWEKLPTGLFIWAELARLTITGWLDSFASYGGLNTQEN